MLSPRDVPKKKSQKGEGKSRASRARKPQVVVTDEILEECFEALASGKTLTAFCKEDPTRRPERRSMVRAIGKSPELMERFTVARDKGFDAMAENVLEIADEEPEDKIGIARNKLRCEVRLRLLSKWCTARYGDKLQLGGDGGEPIRLTNEDRVSRILKLAALAKGRQLRTERDKLTSNGHETNGNGSVE